MLLSIIFKQPKLVKGIAYISSIFWVLALIMTIVIFLFSTILGAVCTSYFSPVPTSPFKFVSPQIDAIFTDLNIGITLCNQNKTLVDVAVVFGVANASTFNMTNSANDLQKVISWDRLVSFIDTNNLLEKVVEDAKNISNYLSPIDNSSTWQTNIQSLLSVADINGSIIVQTPAISTFVSTALQNIQTLNASFNAADYYTFGTLPPSANDLAQATTLWINQVNSLQDKLNEVFGNNSLVSNYTINRNALFALANSLNLSSTLLIPQKQKLVDLFNTTNSLGKFFIQSTKLATSQSIIQFRNSVINAGRQSQLTLDASLSCGKIAQDVIAFESSTCNTILYGLDSTWLSLFLAGICGVLIIPGFVFIANRLAFSKKAIRELQNRDSHYGKHDKHHREKSGNSNKIHPSNTGEMDQSEYI